MKNLRTFSLLLVIMLGVLGGCFAEKSGNKGAELDKRAGTVNYTTMYIRGTNNSWGTTAMATDGNGNWKISGVKFGSTTLERFKFDANGNWAVNFGDSNGDKIAELGGKDIPVEAGFSYDITLNDRTLAYTVTKSLESLRTIRVYGMLNGAAGNASLIGVSAKLYKVTNATTSTSPAAIVQFSGKETDVSFTKLEPSTDYKVIVDEVKNIAEFGGDVKLNGEIAFKTTADNVVQTSQNINVLTVALVSGTVKMTFGTSGWVETATMSLAKLINQKVIVKKDGAAFGEVIITNNNGKPYLELSKLATGKYTVEYNGVVEGCKYSFMNGFNIDGNNINVNIQTTVVAELVKLSTYPTMNIRGTINAWGVTPMNLTADYTWFIGGVKTGNTATERFKFDVGSDWKVNFGQNGVQSGSDIPLAANSLYDITFNDKTKTVTVVNRGSAVKSAKINVYYNYVNDAGVLSGVLVKLYRNGDNVKVAEGAISGTDCTVTLNNLDANVSYRAVLDEVKVLPSTGVATRIYGETDIFIDVSQTNYSAFIYSSVYQEKSKRNAIINLALAPVNFTANDACKNMLNNINMLLNSETNQGIAMSGSDFGTYQIVYKELEGSKRYYASIDFIREETDPLYPVQGKVRYRGEVSFTTPAENVAMSPITMVVKAEFLNSGRSIKINTKLNPAGMEMLFMNGRKVKLVKDQETVPVFEAVIGYPYEFVQFDALQPGNYKAYVNEILENDSYYATRGDYLLKGEVSFTVGAEDVPQPDKELIINQNRLEYKSFTVLNPPAGVDVAKFKSDLVGTDAKIYKTGAGFVGFPISLDSEGKVVIDIQYITHGGNFVTVVDTVVGTTKYYAEIPWTVNQDKIVVTTSAAVSVTEVQKIKANISFNITADQYTPTAYTTSGGIIGRTLRVFKEGVLSSQVVVTGETVVLDDVANGNYRVEMDEAVPYASSSVLFKGTSSFVVSNSDVNQTVAIAVTGPQPKKVFDNVYFRGTPNNWGLMKLNLVSDNTWSTKVTFGNSTNERFKFDIKGDWTQNYGDNNPGDGIAELGGKDIVGIAGKTYTITFNDLTKAYTMVPEGVVVGSATVHFIISNSTNPFEHFGLGGVEARLYKGTSTSYVSYSIVTGGYGQGIDPKISIPTLEAGDYRVVVNTATFKGEGKFTISASAKDYDGIVYVTQTITFNSNYPQVYLRGTNNAWATTKMTLVTHYLWECDVDFGTTTTERFKFDVYGDWKTNFGNDNGDNVADLGAKNDIAVTTGAGKYKIRFNDSSKEFSILKY